MPESDQWNGNDKLPVSHHGDLASESALSVASLTGSADNELVSEDQGEEESGEEKPDKSQGDANKNEKGQTSEERAEKKAEPKGENKAIKPVANK